MNKRFIRVAVFCALTATAAPVFVGCSDDYDADIANLQDQINKINGVVGITGDDMAAAINEVVEQMQTQIDALSATVEGKVNVDELTSQVNALSNLIDQKADPSQIQAEAERLQGLIEAANQAAADANATDRQALEEQIAALETAQEEAERILNDALNGKVDQNTLNEEAARLEGLINEAKKIAEGAVTSEQLDQQINDLQGKLTDAIATATSDMATNADVQAKLDALDKALTDAIATATNDMATNDAVQQKLDALDEALSTAISDLDDSKMSVATFNSLRTELLNAIGAKADTSFVNAQLKQLNAELQTVKDGYATTTITDGLRKDVDAVTDSLVNVNNRLAALEKLNGQVGTAITDIKKLQDDCQGYANRIQALEDAEIKLTDYAEFTNLANRVEALEKTWGAAVRDSIDANTNAIEEINRKLNGYIDEQAGTEVQGIFARLTTLERWKSDNEAALLSLKTKVDVSGLAEGKVADIAQMLADISQLQQQLGLIEQPGEGEEEENTSNFYTKEEIDSKFTELETKMTNLYGEIGLMVQSIVYVPWANGEDTHSSDGNLEFNTLFLTKVSTTTPVAQVGTKKIAFRVSPAAAATDFAKNYDLVLDGKQVKSGENLPIAITNIAGDPTTGIVTCDVDYNFDAATSETSSERTWIFCATLKPKAEAATQAEGDAEESKLTDKLTNITSDYFTAKYQDQRVANVTISHNSNLPSQLTYKDFGDMSSVKAAIDFSGYGLKLSGKNAAGSVVVDDLEAKYGNLFTVNFTENEGNNTYFKMEDSHILKPESTTGESSSVGQKTKVSATVLYGNTVLGEQKDYKEITMVEARYEINVSLANTSHFTNNGNVTTWQKAARTFTLNNSFITQIMNALNLKSEDISALSGSEEDATGNVTIKKESGSSNITVKYAENTYLPTASEITLELNTNTAVKVVITVDLPAMTQLPITSGSFTRTPGYWSTTQANTATFNFKLTNKTANFGVNGGEAADHKLISAVGMTADMEDFFSNYSLIAKTIYENGGTLTWKWTDAKGASGDLTAHITNTGFDVDVLANASIDEEEFIGIGAVNVELTKDYDVTKHQTGPKFKLVADFPEAQGMKPIEYGEYNFTTPGVISSWERGKSGQSMAFENLGDVVNLAEGSKWSIKTNEVEGVIWKDGAPYYYDSNNWKNDNTDAPATNADAFEYLFMFAEPKFEITGITVDGETIAAANYDDYVDMSKIQNNVIENYTLAISEKGKTNIAPGSTVEIKVKVTVTSRFEGVIDSYTTTVIAKGLQAN